MTTVKFSCKSNKTSSGCHRHWCRFVRDRRWSLKNKYRLLEHYECPCVIYQLPVSELIAAGHAQKNTSSLQVNNARLDKDGDWLEQVNHHLVPINSPDYPSLLKETVNPPLALFCRGDRSLLSSNQIGIVGSRRPTPVGEKIARDLAHGVAQLSVAVSSGLALGVDGVAHQAALDTQGKTLAVLGCGIDQIYPARHRRLYDLIAERGLLVSEFPLGEPPRARHFPQRNRVISGLSLGVIIIEAGERSGTMITARLALEQNREVWVVPGSANSPNYRGSHRLLREGAALIESVGDILPAFGLYELPFEQSIKKHNVMLSGDAGSDGHSLLQHLSASPMSVDDLILTSGLTAAEVSSMLLLLEVNGSVAMQDDGRYIRLY